MEEARLLAAIFIVRRLGSVPPTACIYPLRSAFERLLDGARRIPPIGARDQNGFVRDIDGRNEIGSDKFAPIQSFQAVTKRCSEFRHIFDRLESGPCFGIEIQLLTFMPNSEVSTIRLCGRESLWRHQGDQVEAHHSFC